MELADGISSRREVPARLDGDGFVIDPGQVGRHSATFCGRCDALLLSYATEAVFEGGVRGQGTGGQTPVTQTRSSEPSDLVSTLLGSEPAPSAA